MVTESIRNWVTASFGGGGSANWKKAFLSRATTDANGTYWHAETMANLLSDLGACPPSGAFSGPDCANAGTEVIRALNGVLADADGGFRVYWPDLLISIRPKINPLPEDKGPTDPGWIGRPAYEGNADKAWRRLLGAPPAEGGGATAEPARSGDGSGGDHIATSSGGPIEYIDRGELVTWDSVGKGREIVDRMIRAVFELVAREQYDWAVESYHDTFTDGAKREFATYNSDGSTCLDRNALAMILSTAWGIRRAGMGGDVETPENARRLSIERRMERAEKEYGQSVMGVLTVPPIQEADKSPVTGDQALTVADRILGKYDSDGDGCLSPAEFTAALIAIQKPRKLGILEAPGVRPGSVSQRDQVVPPPPPKPFNFGPKVNATLARREGIAFTIPTLLGALGALRWGWVAFAAGGAVGLAAAGVVAAAHAIATRHSHA